MQCLFIVFKIVNNIYKFKIKYFSRPSKNKTIMFKNLVIRFLLVKF